MLRVPLMSKARPRIGPWWRQALHAGRLHAVEGQRAAILAEWWTVPPLEQVNCLVLVFRGPARGDLDNLAGAVL
jgi:hypothetical protein